MTFSDLSEFCRLCLLPLNGKHIDCALDEKAELRDAIKMVYNIDIQTDDEYSTKICFVCADILLFSTIHYLRVVAVQKGLSRVQNIENMLRNLRKKKIEKKAKKPLPSSSPSPLQPSPPASPADIAVLNDIEMIEIAPNCSKPVSLHDCEMHETYDRHEMSSSSVEPHHQLLFGNMTSFAPNQQQQQQQQWQQPQWPTVFNDGVQVNHGADDWLQGYLPTDNGFDMNDVLILPPLKSSIDRNNNNIRCDQNNESISSSHGQHFVFASGMFR